VFIKTGGGTVILRPFEKLYNHRFWKTVEAEFYFDRYKPMIELNNTKKHQALAPDY
jgi:hypothetical protein